jgi:hypothetical protein
MRACRSAEVDLYVRASDDLAGELRGLAADVLAESKAHYLDPILTAAASASAAATSTLPPSALSAMSAAKDSLTSWWSPAQKQQQPIPTLISAEVAVAEVAKQVAAPVEQGGWFSSAVVSYLGDYQLATGVLRFGSPKDGERVWMEVSFCAVCTNVLCRLVLTKFATGPGF